MPNSGPIATKVRTRVGRSTLSARRGIRISIWLIRVLRELATAAPIRSTETVPRARHLHRLTDGISASLRSHCPKYARRSSPRSSQDPGGAGRSAGTVRSMAYFLTLVLIDAADRILNRSETRFRLRSLRVLVYKPVEDLPAPYQH